VYVNNAYGVAVRDVVKTAYSRKGGKIVAEEAVEEGGTNFNSQIAKIKSANPDLVFGLLYYNEGAQFLVQAKQQGMSVPVLGGDAWFGPIGAVAGDAIDLLVFSSVAFGPDRKDSPRMREFIASFEATYGRKPDSYSATGYDAVQVARYAIEEVGASGEKIAKALRTLDFDGALGQVKFNENGDNVGGKFSLFKIRGDKAVPFSP
jgi:branched-chain amino acid transport system substrate-binding protein